MVLSAQDTEREHLSKRWEELAAKIELLPDGAKRDGLLEQQDAIEHRLGELWLQQRADRMGSASPTGFSPTIFRFPTSL